jgi:RNA polymerase sigma-70 factor, ECF subfamily
MKESSKEPQPSFLDPIPTSPEEDVRLIKLAAAGDVPALEKLYDRHAPLMHSVLLQKLGDHHEAQDVVHDVFVKIHTQKARYNPALGQPIAWMLTVARNTAIDKLRKHGSHKKYLQQQIQEDGGQTSNPTGPHDDEIELLHDCVRILSDPQRDALQLAYFSGMTQQEVADQLQQPLGSVKAWIRRGLLKLRECVEAKS